MSHKANTLAIPEHKKAEFKRLTQTPKLATRTITMGILTALCVAFVYLGYFTGNIPLLAATAIITLCYYYTFSPIHDALHRTLAKDQSLNDLIGGINVFLVSPYAGVKSGLTFFRWFHMQHHRFTNDTKDPDNYVHGSWLTMPLRWLTIDYYYVFLAFRDQDPVAVKALKKMAPFIVGFILVLATLIYNGYGEEVLFLWYIPGRLTWLMLGFVFFWLPHAHNGHSQHDVKQSVNPTLATTIRKGWEPLISPIFQCQNYHLIHHLWPTTPFYNNYKVWKLMEDELSECDLAVQHHLHIQPEIQLAN